MTNAIFIEFDEVEQVLVSELPRPISQGGGVDRKWEERKVVGHVQYSVEVNDKRMKEAQEYIREHMQGKENPRVVVKNNDCMGA